MTVRGKSYSIIQKVDPNLLQQFLICRNHMLTKFQLKLQIPPAPFILQKQDAGTDLL